MIEVAPPDELQWLTEALGAEDALRLIELHGGTLLWVPNNQDGSQPAVRDRLEQQLGKETTRNLIRYFGGGRIRVPLCKAWRARLYDARGMQQEDIARRLVCDRKTVWRYLNPDKWDTQLKLAL
jgi:hypothetical protein